MLTARPAAAIDDLRIATELLSRAWLAGSPLVAGTPAALEWWHVVSHPDPLGDHLRIWEEDGRPVAWSWHEDGEIEAHAWSGDATHDTDILRTILEQAVGDATDGTVGAFAAEDDRATIALFGELGFSEVGRRLSQWQRRADETPDPGLPPTDLPAGYRIRSVEGAHEFAARVEAHRRAFPTSRLTSTKYERMLDGPHYRLEDDLVVVAPDGAFAAYAMAWWDPAGLVGEFEPVGTHPDHQRRGLARALLAEGTRRLFERGARVVQVYSDTTSAPAEALYPTIGFRRRAFHQRYERSTERSPAVRSTR